MDRQPAIRPAGVNCFRDELDQLIHLKLHAEGQLPYRSLLRNTPHGDSVVRK